MRFLLLIDININDGIRLILSAHKKGCAPAKSPHSNLSFASIT